MIEPQFIIMVIAGFADDRQDLLFIQSPDHQQMALRIASHGEGVPYRRHIIYKRGADRISSPVRRIDAQQIPATDSIQFSLWRCHRVKTHRHTYIRCPSGRTEILDIIQVTSRHLITDNV